MRKSREIDEGPQRSPSLRRDLAALGITRGMTLVVHSSLSAIGWVDGGAATVVAALLDAVGDTGTLAMPAATPRCSDLTRSQLFDRATTPTTMGAIPDTFRTWPGTRRSDHPIESVCARGVAATRITIDHPLEFSEGPATPFGRLHELDSAILLLGVGFNRCTALHLAETLSTKRRLATVRFPGMHAGRREWIEVSNVADDNGAHFPAIGDQFIATGRVRRGTIGRADSMLFSMRELVTFACDYFERVF